MLECNLMFFIPIWYIVASRPQKRIWMDDCYIIRPKNRAEYSLLKKHKSCGGGLLCLTSELPQIFLFVVIDYDILYKRGKNAQTKKKTH